MSPRGQFLMSLDTVAHSLPSDAVIATLQREIADRGAPVPLSLDNGSEFRSRAFDAWAADAKRAHREFQRPPAR